MSEANDNTEEQVNPSTHNDPEEGQGRDEERDEHPDSDDDEEEEEEDEDDEHYSEDEDDEEEEDEGEYRRFPDAEDDSADFLDYFIRSSANSNWNPHFESRGGETEFRDLMMDMVREFAETVMDMDDSNYRTRDPVLKCPVCNFAHQEVAIPARNDNDQNNNRNNGQPRPIPNFRPQPQHDLSHGARMMFVQIECPVSFEQCGPPVVGLPCGHCISKETFGSLGGRMGEAAREIPPPPSRRAEHGMFPAVELFSRISAMDTRVRNLRTAMGRGRNNPEEDQEPRRSEADEIVRQMRDRERQQALERATSQAFTRRQQERSRSAPHRGPRPSPWLRRQIQQVNRDPAGRRDDASEASTDSSSDLPPPLVARPLASTQSSDEPPPLISRQDIIAGSDYDSDDGYSEDDLPALIAPRLDNVDDDDDDSSDDEMPEIFERIFSNRAADPPAGNDSDDDSSSDGSHSSMPPLVLRESSGDDTSSEESIPAMLSHGRIDDSDDSEDDAPPLLVPNRNSLHQDDDEDDSDSDDDLPPLLHTNNTGNHRSINDDNSSSDEQVRIPHHGTGPAIIMSLNCDNTTSEDDDDDDSELDSMPPLHSRNLVNHSDDHGYASSSSSSSSGDEAFYDAYYAARNAT